MSPRAPRFDVVVVGGGPAGHVAALALAAAGARTAHVAPPAPADNRTTALLAPSVEGLERLGVWADCGARAAPLKTMSIVDATGRLIRAPTLTFDASEMALDAFGWNIANTDLLAALSAAARKAERLTVFPAAATDIAIGADEVSVKAGQETLRAALLVGADGRNSPVRAAAGIETRSHAYPQSAVTLTLAHTRPHHDVSTEFHTRSGPFTLVPLPGDRSSLVWVVDRETAPDLAALDDAALALAVERRAHSMLGKFRLEGPRAIFPLIAQSAAALAAPRVALVGEAAHVVPPIGAQGLNLGLADAFAIAEAVGAAIAAGSDIGAASVTGAYAQARHREIATKSTAIDLVNRSLLSDFLPVQALRAAGLAAIGGIPWLKTAVMRQGLGLR